MKKEDKNPQTAHDIEAIRWHLQNNIQPTLSSRAIEGILNTVKQFNDGELELDSEISDGLTVGEMFDDLKIELE